MASSGLRLEIGPVFSVMERPVRMWTHLLEGELSLKCEGFISCDNEGDVNPNQLMTS